MKKIKENRLVYLIISSFIPFIYILFLYMCNYKYDLLNEILYRETFFFTIVYFIILSIIEIILKYFVNDKKKEFIILFISAIILILNIKFFLAFILIILVTLIVKEYFNFNLNNLIHILIIFTSIFFAASFILASSYAINSKNNSLTYNKKYSVKSDDRSGKNSPNIYWVHCDGMMNLNDIKKYFGYDNIKLKNYLEKNGYYTNYGAREVLGHHTNTALVSFYNPNYYDNFFKEYLNGLEKEYKNNAYNDANKFVSYDTLRDKRLNNEFINGLKNEGYDTYAISEFNEYTSMNVKYFYDYSNFSIVKREENTNKKFRLLHNNNKEKLSIMTDISHLKALFKATPIYVFVKKINILNNKNIKYDDINLDNYKYIKNTSDTSVKKIFKGLDISFKNNNKKFLFIDYNLTHLPILYDSNGKILKDYNDEINLDNYLDNYKFSSDALIDLLKYIKKNDSNAIIIVQGDHGMHTVPDFSLMKYFNVDKDGAYNIKNSMMNAVYVPDMYKNYDDKYLSNPLNISRYIINNYVGKNYEYLK